MNLYALKFRHYSQKDSREGIIAYVIAESSEDIYEWLKSEPRVNGDGIYNSYKYKEEDGVSFNLYDKDYKVIGTETFKERMIRLNGEMYDEDVEISDLYYGLTHYGWELISEGVCYSDVIIARENLKINIINII